jgi:hypothetical protein
MAADKCFLEGIVFRFQKGNSFRGMLLIDCEGAARIQGTDINSKIRGPEASFVQGRLPRCPHGVDVL